MLLPWEYGVRNLARRPIRTGLTLLALSIVVSLILVAIGFIRGLERSLAVSGDPDVILIYSLTSEGNIENSSINASVPDLINASLGAAVSRFGVNHISPELFLASRVALPTGQTGFGLIRGVTSTAPLVRRSVKLVEGQWPGPEEVIVGRLVAPKLGVQPGDFRVGEEIEFEGKRWKISGLFAADGSTFESEIWCRLDDFQLAIKRQDLSLIAMLLPSGGKSAEIDLFCKERVDLELVASREQDYFASLQEFYRPVRLVAWTIVWLVAGAGVFAGLNMMYGAVAGRVREFATLRAIGYRRLAIFVSLMQEGLLLAAAASLIAGALGMFLLDGLAVKFTMGAFRLQLDGVTVLIGCGNGLALGLLGSVPPAFKALRAEICHGLKAV